MTYFVSEYIQPTFRLDTPSPFSAGWRWGLLSRKIFSNFIFLILARYLVNGFLRLNNFFIFFWIHYQLVLIILWFWFLFSDFSPYSQNVWIENILNFTLVILISENFFYFFRFSFGLSDIRFSVKLVYIRSILSRLRFLTSLLIFDSHRFRLISALSILCFISSTLYLFDSSAYYKQTSMLI